MEITSVTCIFKYCMWIVAPSYSNGMSVDMPGQMKSGLATKKNVGQRVLFKTPERTSRQSVYLSLAS